MLGLPLPGPRRMRGSDAYRKRKARPSRDPCNDAQAHAKGNSGAHEGKSSLPAGAFPGPVKTNFTLAILLRFSMNWTSDSRRFQTTYVGISRIRGSAGFALRRMQAQKLYAIALNEELAAKHQEPGPERDS